MTKLDWCGWWEEDGRLRAQEESMCPSINSVEGDKLFINSMLTVEMRMDEDLRVGGVRMGNYMTRNPKDPLKKLEM